MDQKELISVLKKAITDKKTVLGSNEAVKHLKVSDVKLIIISKNCPEEMRKDIEKYAKIAEVDVENFDGTAKELGITCGKPFPIAALTIK